MTEVGGPGVHAIMDANIDYDNIVIYEFMIFFMFGGPSLLGQMLTGHS